MPLPELTVDELIATANHSGTSIIFVEGKDDLEILRKFEDSLGIAKLVLRCGGRETLFQVLTRRKEVHKSNIVFLADQDQMAIFGGHLTHPKLVYTWGYSIENDIIGGSKIDRLFSEEERERFGLLIDLTAKWFSHAIESWKALGQGPDIDVYLENIIDPATIQLRQHLESREEIENHNSQTQRKIRRSYKKLIRGKNLLQLYAIILNRKGRKSRFHLNSIIDVCLTQSNNIKMRQILSCLNCAMIIDDRNHTI